MGGHGDFPEQLDFKDKTKASKPLPSRIGRSTPVARRADPLIKVSGDRRISTLGRPDANPNRSAV